MEQQNLDTARIIGTLIGAFIIGVVMGLIPLITGFVKKRVILGVIGFCQFDYRRIYSGNFIGIARRYCFHGNYCPEKKRQSKFSNAARAAD